MQGLSFRVKMALAFTASALGAIFLLFAAGSYYVNQLQKSNVRKAVELARSQAVEMNSQLALLIDALSQGEKAATARTELQRTLHLTLKNNQGIVLATIYDVNGKLLIQERNGTADIAKGREVTNEPYITKLPDQGSGELELSVQTGLGADSATEIREAVKGSEGQPIGTIALRVVDSPLFHQIQATSRQITSALISGCGILFGFLLLVFGVLWRLFAKQVDLLQSNARLDRMAYVGTLASGLAHEIRNPLSAMNVNLEVMREELAGKDADGPGQASEIALRVQREVSQLNSTLTSFLDFALPSKDGYSDFSLRSLLRELLESHAEQMRLVEITWELADGPPDGAVIAADRRSLHQAFRNILLNAIQIVTNSLKKQIRVKMEQLPHARIRVTVSDTGPGIKPENMQRIFDVFFSTRKGGSGFGLAITRKIIEEHGGSIYAKNNEDALGASFIVELPRDGNR